MSQPQYGGSAFNPGSTPAEAVYMDPTQAAPEAACQAAVTAALSRRAGLESALMVPNMSNPGTHAAPISVDPAGVNVDS